MALVSGLGHVLLDNDDDDEDDDVDDWLSSSS